MAAGGLPIAGAWSGRSGMAAMGPCNLRRVEEAGVLAGQPPGAQLTGGLCVWRFAVTTTIQGTRALRQGWQDLIDGGGFRRALALRPDHVLFLERYENRVNRAKRHRRSL